MANGDRRTNYHLFPWETFAWSRASHGVENSAKVAAPVVSAITGTTATVTVGYTGFGAQHRLLYGRGSNRYECRTNVLTQATAPATVAFGLRELRPSSTYYVIAISTPLGPFPAGGDQTGVPVTSPEVTFTTGVGMLLESPDGPAGAVQDGPPEAPEVTTDGGEPVQVHADE